VNRPGREHGSDPGPHQWPHPMRASGLDGGGRLSTCSPTPSSSTRSRRLSRSEPSQPGGPSQLPHPAAESKLPWTPSSTLRRGGTERSADGDAVRGRRAGR